jgi:hypothetical protein
MILFLSVLSAYAQDKNIINLRTEASRALKTAAIDTAKRWKINGTYNVNVNQGALSNWAAGGDNWSLAVSSNLSLNGSYRKGVNAWDHNIDLAFGMVNTTTSGSRKSSDRIDYLTKYGYEVSKKWYISALGNFRSQFTKGWNHINDSTRILTSDFMAPGYILLSMGIDFKPNPNFSIFLSPFTQRWTVVRNDSLAKIGAFGVPPGKQKNTEPGAYASINWNKKFNDNLTYKTRLDLFSNYKHDPWNIDIYCTNILTAKVSKYISMTITCDVIYDNDTKSVNKDGTEGPPKTQIKETMGIGFLYKF